MSGTPNFLVSATPGPVQLARLSSVLAQSFDEGRDRVVWNLSPAAAEGLTGAAGLTLTEQYVRVDPQHALEGPKPWLVMIEDARELETQDRLVRFEGAAAGAGPWLLVACDTDQSATDPVAAEQALAARLHCEYIGPIVLDDEAGLAAALEAIKQRGNSALLHVRTPSGPPAPHFVPPAPSTLPARQLEVGTYRRAAAEALAELAEHDERILVICTRADALLDDVWRAMPGRLLPVDTGVPHALDWCAALAASGSRPFAFISQEEAQNNLGMIREKIAVAGAPVTLIVERARGAGRSEAGSAALAGMRQLPSFRLLAPKDAAELRDMLVWSVQEPAPQVIWLADEAETHPSVVERSAIRLGQPEVVCQGDDVALLAWGPTVAAAQLAAEGLAKRGVQARVVNCRFAQPVDELALVAAIGGCASVLIVDDADQSGGFGGWMLERLARLGSGQPVAILPMLPEVSSVIAGAHAIVRSCDWLSTSLSSAGPDLPVAPISVQPTGGAKSAIWHNYLRDLSERTGGERAQVDARQLSADVRRWVTDYEEVGSRDLYLWKWCAHGADLTTLPCVAPELRAHVCDTKVLSIVLCVLMDDVADQRGNSHLLDVLLEMTCWGTSRSDASLSAAEQRYATVARSLWAEYLERIRSYPEYEAFEPVLRFDLLQSFNTMRYSYLINSHPYLLNIVEHDLYTPHNMMQTSFATLDLMCSPGFPLMEVGALREAVYHSQCMGRIGNLLSTWRRELANRDFTSGVFARAMMEGDVTLDELEHGNIAELEARIRARGHEAYFFDKWLEHRGSCQALAQHIHALDLPAMVDSHDEFFAMYLGSRGLL